MHQVIEMATVYPKGRLYQLLSKYFQLPTLCVSPLLKWLKVVIEEAISPEVEYRVDLQKRINASPKQKNTPKFSNAVQGFYYKGLKQSTAIVFGFFFHSLPFFIFVFHKGKKYIHSVSSKSLQGKIYLNTKSSFSVRVWKPFSYIEDQCGFIERCLHRRQKMSWSQTDAKVASTDPHLLVLMLLCMEPPLSVGRAYDLLLTNTIKQRWWDVHGYLYMIVLHKIVTPSWEETLSLGGFEGTLLCCELPYRDSHVARISGESVARKKLLSSSLQKWHVANNHVNWRADSSPVKPNDETTTQADPLLSEILRQRIQLSHDCTHDPQKRWDNKCVLFYSTKFSLLCSDS